ncbi:peroxiredoxin [Dietzia natronolimnaea]|uniref:thioredoxin-dependent peroxiredoxin n=1 Tax=Dietzia natronolimnaea TaxID=161920 RepID=A0A2A2WL52_9ACTN|nr:peroxiredoxin [Dietzia natronolimnaea]PAY21928.1 peroxiredoxin [Dietzia natronolimnaea]
MTTPRLEVGQTAPDFTLPDADGNPTSLQDLLTAHGRVVVYVYPAAMTPGCTTETVDFEGALQELREAGIGVVGVSPDAPEKLQRFRDKHGITFPLLSDPDKTMLTEWGAFGEKKNYGKTVMGVIRSTFVVESDGTLSLARYNVRAKGHVAMLSKLLGVDLPEPAEG